MKNIKNILSVGVVVLLALSLNSCKNGEPEFADYDFTASYFPWQYPIRTLVLGESPYYDNSNDLKHQFEIKASMGGVYSNDRNINVEFEVDPSLVENLDCKIGSTVVGSLKMLPSNYYEPITAKSLTIPSGSFNGGVTIKLTDAFFSDPDAVKNTYAISLRMLGASTDSILQGKVSDGAITSSIPSVAQKWTYDPRIASNWSVKPKNFTIFVIKYVNKYHGVYFRRGLETNTTTNTNGGYGWEKKYLELSDYKPKLSTLSLSKLSYADKLVKSSISFNAILEVKDDNTISITNNPTSTTSTISGTGRYTTDIEEWGGKKRAAFYLNYNVTNTSNGAVYQVKDTLVFRDNAVAVEEFTPVIR